MDYIHEIGKRAKSVSAQVQHLSQNQKNEGLRRVAEELENQKSYLMAENEKDIEKAEKDGMKASLIDRLRLTEERIAGMAEGRSNWCNIVGKGQTEWSSYWKKSGSTWGGRNHL